MRGRAALDAPESVSFDPARIYLFDNDNDNDTGQRLR